MLFFSGVQLAHQNTTSNQMGTKTTKESERKRGRKEQSVGCKVITQLVRTN